MKKILVSFLIILAAFPVHAGGISSLIGEYVDVVDSRTALQPLLGVFPEADRQYGELCRREEALETGLQVVFRGGDDIAAVAIGFLVETLPDDSLVYFKTLVPTDSDCPAAAQFFAKIKKIEAHEGVPNVIEPVIGHLPGATAPTGVALLARPDFRAKVVGLISPEKPLRVIGKSGKFLECRDDAGKHGFGFAGFIRCDPPKGETPASGTPDTGDIPPNLAAFRKIDDQKPTYYVTAREEGYPTSGPLYGQNYNGTERKAILTPKGELIATTSGRYFAALCMQGSGIILDGRTCSWGGNQRFVVAPAGCKGITATGYWVVSFHTLAVNRKQMPYLGVYFIPGTRGLELPNGETHDGYWFAHDTGSAFTNAHNRIDMYSDREEWWKWMEAHFAHSLAPIKVYLVDEATKGKVYAKYRHLLGKSFQDPQGSRDEFGAVSRALSTEDPGRVLRRPAACQYCKGTGWLRCTFCFGMGSITGQGPNHIPTVKPCPACHGSGRQRCPWCFGSGSRPTGRGHRQ